MGFKTKSGAPCGFKIADEALCCQHHDVDKTRQRELIDKMRLAKTQLRLPSDIDVGELNSLPEIQAGYRAVVNIAAREKGADLKRLDVITRALNGANTALQTQVLRELNDTILRAEGMGPALILLDGLRKRPTSRLPGRPGVPAEAEQVGPSPPQQEAR